MKKSLITAFLVMLFAISSLIAGTYSGGNGYPNTPYVINTYDDLIELSQTPDDWSYGYCFIQTADIDAYNTKYLNMGHGFTGIGNSSKAFAGTYDGQGHFIDNLYIDIIELSGYDSWRAGFCGNKAGGAIKNLGLTNVDITADTYAGGLIAYGEAFSMENCYTTGNVSGNGSIGGLVGFISCNSFSSASISNSYSNVNVNDNNHYYNTSSRATIGGLVGSAYGYYSTNCTIINSYSTGNVCGTDLIGGLIGSSCGDYAVVENCYSTGVVTCEGTTGRVGGLISFLEGTVNNSFWDIDNSGQSSSVGGIGKTTSKMKIRSTFTDVGWDFMGETINGTDDYWGINPEENDGYPFLEWQNFENNPPAEGQLYISEVSDDPGSKLFGTTGFIELWNDTGTELSLDGHSILQGSNDGSGFVANGTSYDIPDGYTIPVDAFFIIADGALLSSFNAAWGLSLTEAEYDMGSMSLDITNGYAYALDDGTRVIIDETIAIGSGERIYQESNDNWVVETPATSTPGEFGDDDPLPVVLSTFSAIQTQANFAQLNWTTQSESNNAYWNIYRAEENNLDLAISVNPSPIQGQGDSTSETNYTFTDETVSPTNATYWYWLESVSYAGESNICGNISIEMSQPDNPTPPTNLITGLHQNYPNPFNPNTKIQFAVKETTKATLSIYNQKGQKIITLFDGIAQPEQYYNLDWNGKDADGKSVASGLYFYKLETDNNDTIKKMLLIK